LLKTGALARYNTTLYCS